MSLIPSGRAKAHPRPDASAPSRVPVAAGAERVEQTGTASWYGGFFEGRLTASGARFNDRKFTAAHLWLPLSTRAQVTNLANGRSVDVVINDRGPYIEGRIIDLSEAAAAAIGMIRSGLAKVLVTATIAPGASQNGSPMPASAAKEKPPASTSGPSSNAGKQPAVAVSEPRPLSDARPRPRPKSKKAAALAVKAHAGKRLPRGHHRIMLGLRKGAMTRVEKPRARRAPRPRSSAG